MLLKLIKWLLILLVLAAIGLTIYAYLGPLLGVDFSPEPTEMRQEIIFDQD